jgi:hypothetical protein
MNKDIRIDCTFSNHRKRKKLFNALGAQGVLSMIDLWISTAVNRPKGILTGMDESDIALDAQWTGDATIFCKTLCEIGFLDRDGKGSYSIHDWQDHQPFAYYADERSERSRELAYKRWGKKHGLKPEAKEDNTEVMRDACGTHNEGNAPIPSPIPSPIPKDIKSPSQATPNCPHDEIIRIYHETLPSLPRVKAWTEERKKHLRARWAEDPKRHDLSWWKRYFDHVEKSPFLTGDNNRGWTPNLEWLVKQKNLLNVIEGKYHSEK